MFQDKMLNYGANSWVNHNFSRLKYVKVLVPSSGYGDLLPSKGFLVRFQHGDPVAADVAHAELAVTAQFVHLGMRGNYPSSNVAKNTLR